MTLICWDGRYVVADRWGHDRNHEVLKSHCEPKILAMDGVIYASCGDASMFPPLVRWHQAGSDPEQYPKVTRPDWGFLVFTSGRRCQGWAESTPYPVEEGFPEAWGFAAAANVALGAMHAGADAIGAMDIARRLCPQIGGKIMVVDTIKHFGEMRVAA